MTPALEATLKGLPDRPGVYLMKDDRGDVVYVGKAQSLRNRVRSYWQKATPAGEIHRIRSVIDRVTEVEYTLTDSVSEALLLEANLIKRFKPRFNVRLKDDKSYPYIKVTLGDDFPRVERTRKLPNDGSRYFGPYASATSVDESMNLVRRLFPFRTCTIEIKDGERALQRPCLLYHIKKCQGPCIQAISKADYRADIAQVELFLEGRQETLVTALQREMAAAAERTDYETAAALRDKIRAIERTMESQKMAAFARTELDLVGLARQDNQAAVQLFAIRAGKLVGRDVFLLEAMREASDDEVVASFIEQYYARATSIPREVYLPTLSEDVADLEAFLADRRGGPVHLKLAQRGEKRELMALATRNAAETLAKEQARWLVDQGKTLAALEELADALGLPGPPARIECYDISNFQGSESVGSMVVFEEGKPRSGEYRRFRIKTVEGPNDFASHQEVLRRRFRASRVGQEGSEEERRWAMPDLVVDRRRPRPGGGRQGRPRRARPARPRDGRAGEGARGAVPARAAPTPSCSRRPRRRSISSSVSATRRTASRSPTTATCGRSGRSGRPSTTCPVSGRSGSASCSRCSARSSASARHRSSRSPRCRASAARSPSGSRRPSTPRSLRRRPADVPCTIPRTCEKPAPSSSS